MWFWVGAAEEDTQLYFDGPPQFSAVFPAGEGVLTGGGELQQGELQDLDHRHCEHHLISSLCHRISDWI